MSAEELAEVKYTPTSFMAAYEEMVRKVMTAFQNDAENRRMAVEQLDRLFLKGEVAPMLPMRIEGKYIPIPVPDVVRVLFPEIGECGQRHLREAANACSTTFKTKSYPSKPNRLGWQFAKGCTDSAIKTMEASTTPSYDLAFDLIKNPPPPRQENESLQDKLARQRRLAAISDSFKRIETDSRERGLFACESLEGITHHARGGGGGMGRRVMVKTATGEEKETTYIRKRVSACKKIVSDSAAATNFCIRERFKNHNLPH